MVVIKLPAGTRFYLTKKRSPTICIQPDKSILNDNLYVAYDVKIGDNVIIPRGTRVIGDWITESSPSISAQLQLSRIYLQGSGQSISADSDVIESVNQYNHDEVDSNQYLFRTNLYKANSGITRRIVKYGYNIGALTDNNRDTIYIEINTIEIPMTLIEDFTPQLCT